MHLDHIYCPLIAYLYLSLILIPLASRYSTSFFILRLFFFGFCSDLLDWTTGTSLCTSTTFEFQTSEVFRALTPLCCLPVLLSQRSLVTRHDQQLSPALVHKEELF